MQKPLGERCLGKKEIDALTNITAHLLTDYKDCNNTILYHTFMTMSLQRTKKMKLYYSKVLIFMVVILWFIIGIMYLVSIPVLAQNS